ncbi:DUF2384 domain-containing protein [Mesorhizobium hawassense]|uniref:DUF2384 domain-containing protein n=1 Tax=Mesorhizobium hawassense TaxID=1209954 RepID=A0A330HTT5_9HYPH|nr:DUF2384 domain-containing protein [Mesorhizobium hawassense]
MATPTPAPSASPRHIPDLSLEATRAGLTEAALEAFVRLSDIWRITSRQASSLLGEPDRTWFRIKAREWKGTLSQDALTRVSALVGVYKGLHLLFSDPLADEWVRRPNADPLFNGLTPIDFMIKGGIPAMLETRGYVDALRGGL